MAIVATISMDNSFGRIVSKADTGKGYAIPSPSETG